MVFFALITMKCVRLLSVLLLAVLTSVLNVECAKGISRKLVKLKAGVQKIEEEFGAKLSNITGALKRIQAEIDSLKKEGKGGALKRIQAEIDSLKKEGKGGYVSGQHYTHAGGGSNILCLTDDPIYSETKPGHNAGGAIYGSEYESQLLSPNMKKVFNQDVPCAVCRSRSGNSHVMISGSNKCQSGWRSEYDGYLMGPHYKHGSGQYLCVDKNPEAITGGHTNTNGQLFYLVESHCGSLPCPPYKNFYELTCVVCTD